MRKRLESFWLVGLQFSFSLLFRRSVSSVLIRLNPWLTFVSPLVTLSNYRNSYAFPFSTLR